MRVRGRRTEGESQRIMKESRPERVGSGPKEREGRMKERKRGDMLLLSGNDPHSGFLLD